jgi:hypothetical protein
MPTLLQIISSLGVAAIVAAIAYVIRLEKRMGTLEATKVQMGEAHFPKKEAPEFWDKDERHNGWRKARVPVRFDEPFRRQPMVTVALKRFDLGDRKANIHRVGVRIDNVGLKGFDLYFETWHESLVFDAVVSWVAISQ